MATHTWAETRRVPIRPGCQFALLSPIRFITEFCESMERNPVCRLCLHLFYWFLYKICFLVSHRSRNQCFHTFWMESDMNIILVSKWPMALVKYIVNKILVGHCAVSASFYLCWVIYERLWNLTIRIIKGARFYFSKFSFLFHLKNHHSKDVNLNFWLKPSSHLDMWIIFKLQLSVPNWVSLIMVIITRHIFINIFKTEHFSAVKFSMGFEKNTSFLVVPKSPKVCKKVE